MTLMETTQILGNLGEFAGAVAVFATLPISLRFN